MRFEGWTAKISSARRRRGGVRTVVLFAVGLVLLGLAGWMMTRRPPPAEAPGVEQTPKRPMSEEERIAYVQSFVRIEGLVVGPDLRPDSDEAVKGLLRVEGEVLNAGEREVDRVFLEVFPMDVEGEVLSAHVQNVIRKGGALAPGQRRSFRFTIPDKKAFEGRFEHGLR